MANIDITDKIGFALLKKGIIDYETLEKSLKVKESEEKKNRRNLGQILVNDFNADHDAVFREVADLYAFREIYLADEKIDKPPHRLHQEVRGLPAPERPRMLLQTKMLPLRFDEKQPDKLIIIAADPTDRRIPLIARNFGAKKYEVAYCRLKELQNLFEQVVPPENEFLKLLENTQVGIQVKEDDESGGRRRSARSGNQQERPGEPRRRIAGGGCAPGGERYPCDRQGRQPDGVLVPHRRQPEALACAGTGRCRRPLRQS